MTVKQLRFRHTAMYRVSICVALLVGFVVATTSGINDTAFDCRFEYAYRVIQKLAQMENVVANLTEKLKGTSLNYNEFICIFSLVRLLIIY